MSRGRQLPGGGRGVEVGADRLQRWFDRFAERHAGVVSTLLGPRRVEVRAVDGAVAAVRVPFEKLPEPRRGQRAGLDVEPLITHVRRSRRIGLVLVRLGAHSVGVCRDGVVERSSTDRHLVHGRNKAGGQSQQRFARRREGQARRSLEAASADVARVLLPEQATLEAVVLGGDRKALEELRSDSRLAELLGRAEPRVLDLPEPRKSVLDEAARRTLAVEVEIHDAD